MADIEIEIDGQLLKAEPNQTIIQVADKAGIYIPRFCYHQHLTIPANCRMCLVEVEKMPKAAPACATPVMPGMKVFTKSQKTIQAQRAVMEFLLINHPLDCPICDQGGECELQDLAMGYGSPHSRYKENKRAVPDQDLGSLVATEMTRCIHCTRCVRFGDEVAGVRELGLIGRGEFTEISTYVQHAMQSELSGNVIDLCPVGALTSKPYRFTARAWELNQHPSVSPHDCVGANLNIHARDGAVLRVVPRENDDINLTWLADRDRFSYTGLHHKDRITEPMVRVNGVLEPVSWEKAFEIAAQGLQAAIGEFGTDKLAGLGSPSATVEELYLLQKLVRGLGSPHIDHRLRETDTQDQADLPAYPGLALSLAQLEQCDVIILIGSNLQKEQPLLNLRVRKAAMRGASVIVINPVDYKFNFPIAEKHIVAPQEMVATLEKFNAKPSALLQGKTNVCVLLGALSLHHPDASHLRYLAQELAKPYQATVGLLTEGANGAGAWLAGAIPHRYPGGQASNHAGLAAHALWEKPRKAYVLLNIEPELDCANAAQVVHALKQAAFTVALSAYRNPVLDMHADVILPITPFSETSGTFVNLNGVWQSFKGAAKPLGNARPAWKVLRVLGNFLHLDHFNYEDSQTICHEVKNLVDSMPNNVHVLSKPKTQPLKLTAKQLMRIGEIPMYAVDAIVRRAEPLQAAQYNMQGNVAHMRIHPDTAKQLQLQHGSWVSIKQHIGHAKLALIHDEAIAKGALWIAGGIADTAGLGELFGSVELE